MLPLCSVTLVEFDPEVRAYYDRGEEQARLTEQPSLELVRTRVLLERYLPPPPARVLDVGGGAGVYASWLAALGYQVHLIDPVALHVEQARAGGGFTADVGDARHLDEADDSWECGAVAGAAVSPGRTCRPGPRLAGSTSGLPAWRGGPDGSDLALCQFIRRVCRGFVDSPGFAPMMIEDLRSGTLTGCQNGSPPPTFTTHTTSPVRWPTLACRRVRCCRSRARCIGRPTLPDGSRTPEQRELVVQVLATMETDTSMTAATAHLLAVGAA